MTQKRRWTAHLTAADIAVRDQIANGYPSKTHAMRAAIANQVQRDRNGETDPVIAAKVAQSVRNLRGRVRMSGPLEFGVRKVCLWITEADEDLLRTIKLAHELDSIVAAFRFALRMEAIDRGYDPPGGVW